MHLTSILPDLVLALFVAYPAYLLGRRDRRKATPSTVTPVSAVFSIDDQACHVVEAGGQLFITSANGMEKENAPKRIKPDYRTLGWIEDETGQHLTDHQLCDRLNAANKRIAELQQNLDDCEAECEVAWDVVMKLEAQPLATASVDPTDITRALDENGNAIRYYATMPTFTVPADGSFKARMAAEKLTAGLT
ncbi:MAG TPA: hypothetical protein VN962_06760 [Polyangia bacterium]|nr:hypothetical protein [Polyangia bacterium]